jgi:hypothetical protein
MTSVAPKMSLSYGLTPWAQLQMPGLAETLRATNAPLAQLLWDIGQASVDFGLCLDPNNLLVIEATKRGLIDPILSDE